MAVNSTFTPKASLTDAPTNLKEAIDWVLRVTGKDGKALSDDECICGLAAAVTDLLQSVELEYNGYEEGKNTIQELFSRVQSIEGTHVVRQLIDGMTKESQLARLIGWSNGKDDNKFGCKECYCLIKPKDGIYLGKGCTLCANEDEQKNKKGCQCNGGCKGGPATECKCAKAGKCCKCCCKEDCKEKCKKECICYKENTSLGIYEHKESYVSAYKVKLVHDGYFGREYQVWPKWSERKTSEDRAQCARILLGSVCLIWSGLTYMYWTGKYAGGSPRWNNHILDGSGLDDGTLSQWLQALGFPRDMLNNSGPQNRLDQVISDNFGNELFKEFKVPNGPNTSGVKDDNGNTARRPVYMNFAGFVHAIHRDGLNDNVFGNGKDKIGAIFKLYILSCAYFTGLQQRSSTQSTTPRNPKTIREILYWLSALPYSQAYPMILKHGKDKLEKAIPDYAEDKDNKLDFTLPTGKTFTVRKVDLYAHLQAVTQYCPLVLIGIQGGLGKSTDNTKEPAIHAIYSNTECSFTYPSVDIQAYNQVVHYIRALFYQLYFLRKQCAVKVTCGGKWRECRYGSGVLGNGVISWMCLGCDPMEHDRKKRVEKVKDGLVGVVKKVEASGEDGEDGKELIEVLKAFGDVVVQLGNAQEVLEKSSGNVNIALAALKKVSGVNGKNDLSGVLGKVLGEVEKLVEALEKVVKDGNALKDGVKKAKDALTAAEKNVSSGDNKDKLNAAHYALRQALDYLAKGFKEAAKNDNVIDKLSDRVKETVSEVIEDLISICNSPKCPPCHEHANKCGKPPVPRQCPTCHQQYMDGFPSPLQAFLEDRLPGFSCEVVRDMEDPDKYPPAASHLEHCGGSGQCCPLPMGFRGQFHTGSASNCTGARIYGILYFFSNENMMESCVYTLVRVTAALSATTPQVLGDVFGFFRGGIGEKESGKTKNGRVESCGHTKDPSTKGDNDYFCGWCASGLRDVVKEIEWVQSALGGKDYRTSVGAALIGIKGDKDSTVALSSGSATTNTSLSALTEQPQYVSPLTGELYTAVSATFGGTYLSWVLYLSDALEGGLQSLASAFKQIECRGCRECDPNKCKKGAHGDNGGGQCGCQSIVSCTGVLPVLYRHGFGYGNPFNLEGYQQENKESGDYSIEKTKNGEKHCHQFLDSLSAVIDKKKEEADQKGQDNKHPLTELLKQVGKLQYDIRLPWIFVLTVAWLVAVLYLAFGAIWPLDWTHMRSHWLRGGKHQWQCMWYKVMTGRKGMELVEYFGKT